MEQSAGTDGFDEPVLALLHDAERLYDLGCSAIRSDSYDEAVDCLSKALEIRVQHYGELGPECAKTYYKLGCALLYKVQAESDPLVERNGQQQQQPQREKESSSAEGTKAPENEESEEEEEEEDEEEEKNPGDVRVADEDMGEDEDSDLELSWKMLDIARVIYAKEPQRTVEEADVIMTLGDVSLEKEDFQLCFEDYQTALSALESLVELDDRRIAELCFKISLAKQLEQRPQDALDYCRRAISVCERRLQRLTKGLPGKGKAPEGELNGHVDEGVEKTVSVADKVDSIADGVVDAAQPKGTDLALEPEQNDDVKEIEELLVDLREKEEELQQMATAPSLLEAMKSANPAAAALVKEVYSAGMGLLPAVGNGASVSTVQVGSSSSVPVTNLGVMGRGVKRATPTPVVDEQFVSSDVELKKRTLEDVRNGDSSGDTQIGFNGKS